jgi:hypothetical protein
VVAEAEAQAGASGNAAAVTAHAIRVLIFIGSSFSGMAD